MDVLLGFLIITALAIPVCLLRDRINKRKKDAWLKKILSGEIKSSPSEESGKIQIIDGIIKYTSVVYGQWEVPVEKLIMIGEMTDANGPFIDDWFLCLLTKDKKWLKVSNYADGVESVVLELGQILKTKIELTLFASTSFRTNILWPEKYAGYPIIILSKEKRKTFWGKIFGLSDIKESYSESVQNEINKC